MTEQRFDGSPSLNPSGIVVCGSFVLLAIVFGLAAIVLRNEILGCLAGLSYLGSCLAIPPAEGADVCDRPESSAR